MTMLHSKSTPIRGMAELPARKEEVEHAEEEGIIFKTLCNPVAIHPDEDGFVHSMTCIEMELGEPDASGRRRPIEKQGSEFELDVDTVIMSLGTSPNPLIRSTTPGLETNKHGCIVTEGDEGKTSRDGVYAGGDAVTGALKQMPFQRRFCFKQSRPGKSADFPGLHFLQDGYRRKRHLF